VQDDIVSGDWSVIPGTGTGGLARLRGDGGYLVEDASLAAVGLLADLAISPSPRPGLAAGQQPLASEASSPPTPSGPPHPQSMTDPARLPPGSRSSTGTTMSAWALRAAGPTRTQPTSWNASGQPARARAAPLRIPIPARPRAAPPQRHALTPSEDHDDHQ
jgi:hypothetical protein